MATNNCRNTVKVLDCGNDLENQHKNVYEPFSVCLPFGSLCGTDRVYVLKVQ